jgi:hypothetical protein
MTMCLGESIGVGIIIAVMILEVLLAIDELFWS